MDWIPKISSSFVFAHFLLLQGIGLVQKWFQYKVGDAATRNNTCTHIDKCDFSQH